LDTSIIGGANADYGTSAAMTSSGDVYLAGNTWSNDYPTIIGSYDNVAHDDLGYSEDAYVSEIDNFVDTEPPVITKIDPAYNATNVALNKAINVVFNEPIKQGSNFAGISLTTNGNPVAASKTITGNTLYVIPTANYARGTTYTLYIPADAIEDLAGNIGDENTTNFTTVPSITPLAVTSTDPVNNAVSVPVNKVIKITFNKAIRVGPKYSSIVLKTVQTL
jgi:methionine-rich copper-binding protein CopC